MVVLFLFWYSHRIALWLTPGYFERLLERSQQLPDSLGEVKRAEARRLANELWLWRQWWLEKT